MRTGIPPQYMKQINNGKIEIHIKDMVTPTYSPPPPPTGQVNSYKWGIMYTI